jgi:nucleotide-binding universal stress UspA family protein
VYPVLHRSEPPSLFSSPSLWLEHTQGVPAERTNMIKRRRNPHFRKILVGYGGSAHSERAVELAISLARCLDSKLLIFAVATPPEPSTAVELEAVLDDAREHYEAYFKKIQERTKDEVDIETAIAVGHPAEQIVHKAEVEHMDLIVLGRSRMSIVERLLGSTSERVLRYAHCPVMVVR